MANYKGGVTTICPYYLREARLSISCESPINGSQNMQKFEDVQAKLKWKEKVCSTFRYGECPIVKSIESGSASIEIEVKDAGPNEQTIYDFIVTFTKENMFPPSIREICEGTNYSSTRIVNKKIDNLSSLGLIEVAKNKSRAIKLIGYKITKK